MNIIFLRIGKTSPEELCELVRIMHSSIPPRRDPSFFITKIPIHPIPFAFLHILCVNWPNLTHSLDVGMAFLPLQYLGPFSSSS